MSHAAYSIPVEISCPAFEQVLSSDGPHARRTELPARETPRVVCESHSGGMGKREEAGVIPAKRADTWWQERGIKEPSQGRSRTKIDQERARDN
jgi:hypothetical protein